MNKENICKNCLFWQPNGGVLNRGYCVAKKWVYRAAWQTCEEFEEGIVFRIDYDLQDFEGTISTRCVRVKATTEAEARRAELRVIAAWVELNADPKKVSCPIPQDTATRALRLIAEKIAELEPKKIPTFTQLSLFD